MGEFNNIPNKLITDTEGNKHWISPSISVDAVLVNMGRVLVVQRSEKMSNPKKWCLPCGFMDWNETPLEACMRELFEETGVDVRDFDIENPDFNRPFSLNGTALQFKFEVFTLFNHPPVTLDKEECIDYKWITLDEISTLSWAFGHDELIPLILIK